MKKSLFLWVFSALNFILASHSYAGSSDWRLLKDLTLEVRNGEDHWIKAKPETFKDLGVNPEHAKILASEFLKYHNLKTVIERTYPASKLPSTLPMILKGIDNNIFILHYQLYWVSEENEMAVDKLQPFALLEKSESLLKEFLAFLQDLAQQEWGVDVGGKIFEKGIEESKAVLEAMHLEAFSRGNTSFSLMLETTLSQLEPKSPASSSSSDCPTFREPLSPYEQKRPVSEVSSPEVVRVSPRPRARERLSLPVDLVLPVPSQTKVSSHRGLQLSVQSPFGPVLCQFVDSRSIGADQKSQFRTNGYQAEQKINSHWRKLDVLSIASGDISILKDFIHFLSELESQDLVLFRNGTVASRNAIHADLLHKMAEAAKAFEAFENYNLFRNNALLRSTTQSGVELTLTGPAKQAKLKHIRDTTEDVLTPIDGPVLPPLRKTEDTVLKFEYRSGDSILVIPGVNPMEIATGSNSNAVEFIHWLSSLETGNARGGIAQVDGTVGSIDLFHFYLLARMRDHARSTRNRLLLESSMQLRGSSYGQIPALRLVPIPLKKNEFDPEI